MESLMVRKTIFEQFGYFDNRYKVGEVTDWFARAVDMKIPYDTVKEVLVRMRVHDKNITSQDRQIIKLLRKAIRNSAIRKRAN